MKEFKFGIKKIFLQSGIVLFIALMLLVSASTASAQDNVMRRYALYIGSNYGGDSRQTLSYAVSDAQTVLKVMQQLGGVMPMDSIILTDPTPSIVDRTIKEIKSDIDNDDSRRSEFFFYYSGHSDEKGLLLGNSIYGYDRLKDAIGSVGADVNIAVLDSCSSGAFTRTKGGVRRSPFLSDDSVDASGHAFLTSSSEDEAAQESDDIGASFFTHYFIAALRGAGDSTLDGTVSLNEAYSYASVETLARTEDTLAGPQHPSYDIQLAGTGDLILTDLRAVSERLVFDKELSGHIFIRDSAGRLIVELRKKEGAPLVVSISPGRYSISLDDGEELLSYVVVLEGEASLLVARDEFCLVTREVNTLRGGEQAVSSDSASERDFSYGVFPVSNNLKGVQLGLIGSVNTGNLHGAQFSGIWSSSGSASYLQFSGIFNLADTTVDGVQFAGIFNIANEGMDGVQLSGVFNHTGNLRGAQIGLLNIGGSVTGVQIGLINISEEMHGVPIGLINISKDGLKDLSFWYGSDETFNFGLQFGTTTVYSFLTAGFSRNFSDSASLGLGYGIELGTDNIFLDLDLYGKTLQIGGSSAGENLQNIFITPPDVFPAARLSVGVRLFNFLSFFAGVNVDCSITAGKYSVGRSNEEFYGPVKASVSTENFKADFYPVWFLGVRI